MKYFLGTLAAFIFCQPLWVRAQRGEEKDLIEFTLERVNQFKINNQNDSALYELFTLNRTLKELGRESGYIFVDVGNIYFQLRLDNMARTFYGKADGIFKADDDPIGQAIVLENLGNIHSRLNPGSDSTLYYFNEALRLQQQASDPFYAAHSQRALAMYYSHQGKFEEAHQLMNEAIRAVENSAIRLHPRYKWDVQFIPQQVYLSASRIFQNEGKWLDSAEFFLMEAIRMTRVHGIDAHRVRYTTFMGTFYLETQQWPKAFVAIQNSLELADSIGYVWGKVGALQALRNYYHQTKDAKKEAEAAYNYLLYKDQMYNERNNDDLMIMSNVLLQYENELEIERQQNLVLEQERVNQFQRQQNYLLLGILVLLAVGLVVVGLLYQSLQRKNKLVEQYSKDLESSNETMRTLLSVISHDVRSPFNSLLGLSKVTLMEKELSPDEYRARVSMMHDTSSKGLILLDNLLQWVALQRDKTLLRRELIGVVALVDETLHELSSVALTQNVEIEKRVADLAYETDRNAMKVIVRNLLTNAIKYSSGKKVMLDIGSTDTHLLITVVDQGPGIPEDILQNLFQTGDMKKVAAKGGGLGMQIVKQLVEQMNGKISARNLPQGGAQFEVQLPLKLQ
jgi:signal transduction histidine kinase